MDPLVQALINAGGFGALAGIMLLLHWAQLREAREERTMTLRAFREETEARRAEFDRRAEQIVAELRRIADNGRK